MVVTTWGGASYWHLVGRGWGSCYTPTTREFCSAECQQRRGGETAMRRAFTITLVNAGFWFSSWESRNSTQHSYIFVPCPGQNSPVVSSIWGILASLCCPWIHKFSSKFMLTLTLSRWQESHKLLIKGHGLSFSPLRTVRIQAPLK